MDNFKINSYFPIIDSLIVGINQRLDAFQFLCSRFGFLSNILRMSNEGLRKSAAFLREYYPDDLEKSLASELVQFAAMMKNILSKTDDSTHGLELKLFRILHENHLLELFSSRVNASSMGWWWGGGGGGATGNRLWHHQFFIILDEFPTLICHPWKGKWWSDWKLTHISLIIHDLSKQPERKIGLKQGAYKQLWPI